MLEIKDERNGAIFARFKDENGTELLCRIATMPPLSGWILHDLNIAWLLKNVKNVARISYFEDCGTGPKIQAAFENIFPDLPILVNVEEHAPVYVALQDLYNERVSQ